MTHLRKLSAAVTLIFVLSLYALAGEIHTDVVSPPPPPPPASATTTEPGDITTDATESATQSETLLTEITLSLLQLLSVF